MSIARTARRTLLVVCVVTVCGAGALLAQRTAEQQPPPVAAAPAPRGEAGDRGETDLSGALSNGISATSRPVPTPSPIGVPESGPGTFRTAAAQADRVGPKDADGNGEAAADTEGLRVYRYRVQVEDGIALEPAEAAAEIHGILGHPRGWTNDGRSAFELVAGGRTELTVKIATPGTVDRLCGQYGLDTQGEVNCRIGDDVVVNLRRWVEGSPQFDGPIEEYRALVINHEVGHRLGHGHAGCPGKGRPAPAMMQQIKGLDGCVANAWPYDADGGYLDGPWVP